MPLDNSIELSIAALNVNLKTFIVFRTVCIPNNICFRPEKLILHWEKKMKLGAIINGKTIAAYVQQRMLNAHIGVHILRICNIIIDATHYNNFQLVVRQVRIAVNYIKGTLLIVKLGQCVILALGISHQIQIFLHC